MYKKYLGQVYGGLGVARVNVMDSVSGTDSGDIGVTLNSCRGPSREFLCHTTLVSVSNTFSCLTDFKVIGVRLETPG